eukprot:37291-Rhodomonas_salina.2
MQVCPHRTLRLALLRLTAGPRRSGLPLLATLPRTLPAADPRVTVTRRRSRSLSRGACWSSSPPESPSTVVLPVPVRVLRPPSPRPGRL